MPALLARHGIGSRGVWLGGGLGAFLAFVLYSLVWWKTVDPEELTYDWPPSAPLGGVDGYCLFLTIGFMVAAIFCRPKTMTDTGLISNIEGRVLNGGRADGKNESD